MANESERLIKNSINYSELRRSFDTNSPSQYANQQRQYMADVSRQFIAQRAYLSSDYVVAEVQGITDNFYEFVTTKIRLSDIISPSISISRKTDDFKEILFADPKIAYIPVGAKINTMGSTWLVINPSNIASAQTSAVIVRCNTSYNSYNQYGALVTEPIYVEKSSMLGNDDFTKQNLVLIDGYFNVICQLNENTKKLGHNQRIMLGTMPYHITGFTDFMQEFSGDRESVHLLSFTARLEEATQNDDTEDDFVANGESQEYSVSMIGAVDRMAVAESVQLSAALLQGSDEILPSTENPITWIWISSDNSVVSVDSSGLLTALKEGNASVSVSLAQNEAIKASIDVSVTVGVNEPYVKFTTFSDASISQYDSEIYTAAYFENGEETSEPIIWTFSGASDVDYTADVDGNTVMITCDSASDIPLILTASCNGYSASVSIALEGY